MHRRTCRQSMKRGEKLVDQCFLIVVKGRPQTEWSACFEEVDILPMGNDQYLLRGVFSDQPALHGLLDRIGTVGLELVSVKFIQPDKPDSYQG